MIPPWTICTCWAAIFLDSTSNTKRCVNQYFISTICSIGPFLSSVGSLDQTMWTHRLCLALGYRLFLHSCLTSRQFEHRGIAVQDQYEFCLRLVWLVLCVFCVFSFPLSLSGAKILKVGVSQNVNIKWKVNGNRKRKRDQ